MNLKDLSIIIDGYNLEMSYGTGIKTYTINLIKSLTKLGANIYVLFSKSSENNPILDEVLFFENPIEMSNFQLVKNGIKSLLPIHHQAKLLQLSEKVIIQDLALKEIIGNIQILNLSNCYTQAKIAYNLFGYDTKIKSPCPINVWHKTYPAIPITVQNSQYNIVTIHDLIPLKLPYTTLDNKKLYYKAVKNVVKKSDLIITVSESSKKDILDFYDVDPDKIYVTYQAINPTSLAVEQRQISFIYKKYGLEFNKYILFVGAIEPKKNIGRLIDAYTAIDTDLPLVIVGKKGWLWQEDMSRIENNPKIKILNYVSSDYLKYLYVGAYCFVFPSIYEGFGLPPLEAMSLGCPVITSDIPPLREVCQDAALYVDPYDTYSIQQGIEKLLSQPELRTELITAGKERVEFFSLENYTQKLYTAYSRFL